MGKTISSFFGTTLEFLSFVETAVMKVSRTHFSPQAGLLT